MNRQLIDFGTMAETDRLNGLLYAIGRIVVTESPYVRVTGEYACRYCQRAIEDNHEPDCPVAIVRQFVMEYEDARIKDAANEPA